MATISGYDSSSIGVLFSSLRTSGSNNNNSLFSGADMLGINYSDYACIRNGSYYKLLSAYYATGNTAVSESAGNNSTSTARDDAKTLARIEGAAADTKESAQALLETGTKSVFKEVTKTAEDGTKTTGYDTDAIYKAVSSFVEDYNNLLTQAGDSDTLSILRSAKSMVTGTAGNEKMLASIGITIGDDNKLTVDEEKFKKADMTTVKSLFNERGSFGYQVATRAAMIESYAKTEAAKSNTYTSSGTYTYNYSTGELYNSYI